jgi:ribonuclease D
MGRMADAQPESPAEAPPWHRPQPLEDAPALQSVVAAIRRARCFAIDLEFMSEDRYVPDLALVQVAWHEDGARDERTVVAVAVDPLAVDPRPVLELVGDPSVETVIHAAQADLALIGHAFSIAGTDVLDTQIAAAFLGMGDQIGYAPLIARTLGIEVDKGSQFTEWLQRPLSEEQLTYALDDVRFLLPAWDRLREALDERGRVAWVLEESMRLAETWAERAPADEAYRRISGWNNLRPRQRGSLRALAAWRERQALHLNRPPGRLLNDRSMLELARRPPRDRDALAKARGVGDGLVRRFGDAVLDALRAGAEQPPPPEPRRQPPAAAVQVWSSMLGGLVQAYCRDADIAARFVASRADVEALARWWGEGDRDLEPALPLLRGWRRALVGEAALAWLAGDTSIVADPGAALGVRLESRDASRERR